MGLLYGTLCYYKLNGWLLSHWATVFTQCKFSFLKSENKKNKYKTSANANWHTGKQTEKGQRAI